MWISVEGTDLQMKMREIDEKGGGSWGEKHPTVGGAAVWVTSRGTVVKKTGPLGGKVTDVKPSR